MKKKTLGLILQIPFILVVIASFFAGIYAVYNKIGGINWMTPVILAVIIIVYFYGRYLEKKAHKEIF